MENQLQVDLLNEQLDQFQEQGYLNLGRITSDAEIESLKEVCAQIVERKTGYTLAELAQISRFKPQPAPLTVSAPKEMFPALKNTTYYRNALRVVARLLETEETNLISGWRLFIKPPGCGGTPWHQDAAYRPPPYRSATIWLPLDPMIKESGCLQFIEGSHRQGIQPYQANDGFLITENVNEAQAVACPLLPGEATVHHCFVLHYAGPNQTDQLRRVLVTIFQATGR
ncbi:MAG: phytanoyl-CoA dioxygenase family protein [Anaerolineales bacterium]|nr:phytanoyl-CoA dioxygenase family protein [Anaerolineales bacterium]